LAVYGCDRPLIVSLVTAGSVTPAVHVCCQPEELDKSLISTKQSSKDWRSGQGHKTIFKGLEERSGSFETLGKPVRELVSGTSLITQCSIPHLLR